MGNSKYPLLNRRQILSILKSLGFQEKNTVGSHEQWEGITNKLRRVVTVKQLSSNSDQYSNTLMKSMIDQSGLSKKEFYKIHKN